MIVDYFDKNGFCIAIHAEMAAISYYKSMTKYKPRGKLCLIVVRFDANNNLVESKPCSDCIKAMLDFGIHSVKYTTSDGGIVTEKVKNIDSRESVAFKTMRAIYKKAKDILDN
jgi:deoxycytidylate deaminase